MSAPRTCLLGIAAAIVLSAHTGESLQPHDLWSAWRFNPGVCGPPVLTAFFYFRGMPRAQGIPRWQPFAFAAGMLALSLALISPLHSLGEVLFSAHMLQHEILMLIAAPLLVLARPLVPLIWGMPMRWRRLAGRWSKSPPVRVIWTSVTRPAVAWIVHAAALWFWHIPSAFQATLTSEWVHAAQHISFFGSALLFWWALFASHADAHGASTLYLFTTGVHTSLLGALLTFGHTAWYPAYNATGLWGLSALEDQQLGGLIMWVPGGLVYLGAALYLFAVWLQHNGPKRSYAA